MIRSLLTLYNPLSLATTITYMLQNTEYASKPYLAWFWRTQDFSRVMYRRTLDQTRAARLMRDAIAGGAFLEVALGIAVLYEGIAGGYIELSLFGAALILAFPVLWAHLVVVALWLGRQIVAAKQQELIEQSRKIFTAHPGVKIAVAGSYGKTSMKELLVTVLGEKFSVAATPGNKNVAISHAYFAKKLTGHEDVLVIEYGEGRPGDVAEFAENTRPTHGIITGLAPAHLDQYKTLQAAGKDIFALADFLKGQNVYVNDEPEAIKPFIKSDYHAYNHKSALGWKATNIKVNPDGTSFDLTKGKKVIKLKSGLLGRHNVGALSLVAALGLELGLSEKQVQDGIAKTKPYEHRMQPRQVSGGWIIDDTYNGNLEGVRAGTALLASLPAKRKMYVTPGLVDQGKDSAKIHEEMGKLIAAAKPDVVVLMQNSTTEHIKTGLKNAKYTGEVTVENDPLNFYTNLDKFVATGDVLLMQNDWPDNYN